jgi:hypothetical protein
MNDSTGRIAVYMAKDFLRFFYFYAQFLAEFSSKRRLPVLSGFELAAGKLPFERKHCVAVSLANQNTTLFGDKAGNNVNRFGLHIKS